MKDEAVKSGAYRQSDIDVVLSRGDWHNWHDAVHWLEAEGEGDNELTGAEVSAMAEDFRALQEQGVPFSKDPIEVFNEVNKYQTSEH